MLATPETRPVRQPNRSRIPLYLLPLLGLPYVGMPASAEARTGERHRVHDRLRVPGAMMERGTARSIRPAPMPLAG